MSIKKKKHYYLNGFSGPFNSSILEFYVGTYVSKRNDMNCVRHVFANRWMPARSPPKITFKKSRPTVANNRARIRDCRDGRGLVSTEPCSFLWQVKRCRGQKAFQVHPPSRPGAHGPHTALRSTPPTLNCPQSSLLKNPLTSQTPTCPLLEDPVARI